MKRNSIFSVQQLNPQIHSDSRETVNRVREDMQHLAASDEDAAVQERLRRRGSRDTQNINCPICLMSAHFPIETSCGHIFCGNSTDIREYKIYVNIEYKINPTQSSVYRPVLATFNLELE